MRIILIVLAIAVSVLIASAHGTEDWTLCDLATGQTVLISPELAPLLIDAGTHALPSETTVCSIPTEEPDPTAPPTEEPTTVPTEEPTTIPTEEPTVVPTEEPTAVPTTAVPPPVVTDPPPAWVAPTAEPFVCEPEIKYVYIYVTVTPEPVRGQRWNQ